jgi:hypothetical protein
VEEEVVVAKDLGNRLEEAEEQGSLLVVGREEKALGGFAGEKEVGDVDGLGGLCLGSVEVNAMVICCILGAQIALCGFYSDSDFGCSWDCVVDLCCDRDHDYMTGFGCGKDFDPWSLLKPFGAYAQAVKNFVIGCENSCEIWRANDPCLSLFWPSSFSPSFSHKTDGTSRSMCLPR